MSHKLPTILDNRLENRVLAAFQRILPHTKAWDVATGYFEIGALLDLDGQWQKLDQMRVLLGDEMTERTRRMLLTKKQIVESLREQTEESIEDAKEKDDALTGLPAIRQALTNGHIKTRVYSKAKFHAKGYIMDGRDDSLVDYAVVGSSNFTHAGLTQNIELNLLSTDQNQIKALRDWYEAVWKEGEDVAPEVLKVIDKHLREYRPFEVYAKALYEYFVGREKSQTDWERNESVIYPMLSKYQKDGYHRALQIAERWNGALICDGVGLGKTFIGLMLLENALYRRKKVLLIVPLSGRKSVWERNIDLYLKPKYRRAYREQIVIHNHTDFGRDGTIPQEDFDYYKEFFDEIIVDEGHHFRHSHRTRAKKLMELAAGKRVYLLTATPINNSLVDLYNLINYFAQGNLRHFSELGIQNLRLHFTRAERAMRDAGATKPLSVEDSDREAEAASSLSSLSDAAIQANDFLRTDALLKEVLIQRSRKYVMESEALEANRPVFPQRMPPEVISYSLNQVYAGLYEDIKLAFQKDAPMLTLAIYNTEFFKKREGDKDTATLEYQALVIGLIRTLLLKRLESSYAAFQASLEDLLRKMGLFIQANNPAMWDTWKAQNLNLWTSALLNWEKRMSGDTADDDEEENEVDFAPAPLDPAKYNVQAILTMTLTDMTQLVTILTKVYQKLSPQTDDKIAQLTAKLKAPEFKGEKVVIFTEFRDTARYLYHELQDRFPDRKIEELDSGRAVDRERVIKRFAPYYNCNPAELDTYLADPIDILVTTDVLSEGLNLQDCGRLMNYDVHWNPVRLMQRVGRVDRRLDLFKPVHHERVFIYNFLPPKELEDILHLLKRVTGKILRINKTLGIEAPILRPDDTDAALKDFNAAYEQQESTAELLELELQRIEKEYPETYQNLPELPRRLFSGKRASNDKPCGLFAAYRFPAPSEEATGELRWYFRAAETGQIIEGVEAIAEVIRCDHDTPRVTAMSADELKAARGDIERQKVNRHLRDMQAVAGAKATLICYMEVC